MADCEVAAAVVAAVVLAIAVVGKCSRTESIGLG